MPDTAASPEAPTVTWICRSSSNVPPVVPAVTVTVVAPALSGRASGFVFRNGLMESTIVGSSSSVIVADASFTVSPVEAPPIVSASSPSMILSSVGVRENVPVALVLPAAIEMSKAVTAA